MEIAITFNQPAGEEKATVRFGETNTADQERRFRVGYIKTEETPLGVHWSLLDWVGGNDEPRLRDLELEVARDCVVRVERLDANGAVTFFEVDLDANWPAGAFGGNPILSSWSFED